MREIVLDTETTGLSPQEGHRIVEIGALEMVHHVPTGRTYHVYINPERPIDADASAVHGITDERVASEPVFGAIADDFLEFIGDSPLVIHNAPFDMGFLNVEFERCGRPPLPEERAIDTLVLARKKFPGGQASLDALCKRFGIDNSHRQLHGAMIDTDLLAEVYIELLGGRQPGLTLAVDSLGASPSGGSDSVGEAQVTDSLGASPSPAEAESGEPPSSPRFERVHQASASELAAHRAFIQKLKAPVWGAYDSALKPPVSDD